MGACPDGRPKICGADCQPDCGDTPCETPVCVPGDSGIECSWGGTRILTLDQPCPSVTRDPWPRGLVGVPMWFSVSGTGNAPSASGDVWIDAITCEGRTIVGYLATAAWGRSLDPADTRWTMDERTWNIGRISDDIVSPHTSRQVSQDMPGGDLTIRNERTGSTVAHIYETSSVDKPRNGPGWPNASERQPAYQVSVRTKWTLTASFWYRQRRIEQECWKDNNPATKCTCPESQDTCRNYPNLPGCNPAWTCHGNWNGPHTVIYTDTHRGPTLAFTQWIDGATTPQDAGQPSTCGVIGTPVIQAQSVLVP
jgi:hypothetical protein